MKLPIRVEQAIYGAVQPLLVIRRGVTINAESKHNEERIYPGWAAWRLKTLLLPLGVLVVSSTST